ncbi:MAG: CoA transferase [Methylobacteriaceae bacterium]|nr:CoA transferase [Methylobacteriaceae bacterium]
MSIAAPSQRELVADLWALAGLGAAPLDALTLTGQEPVLPSSFRVDALAQATIAAVGLAAAELRRRAGLGMQAVAVDIRRAALEFRSERHLLVDGGPAPELWDALAGLYRCGDGRWVRLHTNFPHHRAGVVDLLGCADTRESVAAALGDRSAEAFEGAASARGLVVAAIRSFAEWDAHDHAAALAGLPLFGIERLADAPPKQLPTGDRPLAGLRVLDLTRIIAGPVAARALAAHGAEVLAVTSPNLPAVAPLVIETGRGKRQAAVDLRRAEDRATLESLIRDADVFIEGYRPGGLAELGFGPERLAELNPRIIAVSLSAYGWRGPWADKRGFDSLVQAATGFNHAEQEAAGDEKPRALPCQALDHATGYLLAFAALAAVMRRAEAGGAWRVRACLARTGLWLRGLGRLRDGLSTPEPSAEEIAAARETADSGFGRLATIRHAAELAQTPARWDAPAMPLGSHPPRWSA